MIHAEPHVRWRTYALRRFAAALAVTIIAAALWLQLAGGATTAWHEITSFAVRAPLPSFVLATAAGALRALISPPPRRKSTWDLRIPLLMLGTAGVLIVALSADAPWRLAANLLCFLLVGVPLALVTAARAGVVATTDATLAFCVFALVPTASSVGRPPGTMGFESRSSYRWSVGFPTTEWRVSHEVRLQQPPRETPLELLVWLAREQTGDAQLHASLNGVALGPLSRGEFNTRFVAIPRDLSAGQTTLRFELMVSAADPTLRLLAHPWPGGASAGSAASQYFDGQRWWPGTFNDLAREPRSGIYVLSLRGLWR